MAVLCFLEADQPRLRFPLSPGRTLIGRSDQNDLALPDADISRVHLVLERRSEGWWLLHRGRNPTLLNGEPVTTCQVRDGDLVQIGRFLARFEEGGPSGGAGSDRTTTRRPREAVHEEVLGTGEFGVAVEKAAIRFVSGPLTDVVRTLDQARITLGGPEQSFELPGCEGRQLTLRVNRGRVMVDPADGAVVMVAGIRTHLLIPVFPGEAVTVGPHVFVVERAVEEAKEERDRFGAMVGATPVMRHLYGVLARMAHHSHPVLLLGESGTGKELAARGLHDEGIRPDGPFIAVNCAALPDTLVESVLFGHVKGSFTGALRDQDGAFQQAHGGTIFLDEIGELRLDAQAKLLRTLESGEVRRVGADQPEFPSVRILAATHRDLGEMAERGLFRADLLFRLSVLAARIPPLRDRLADIPLVFQDLVRRGVLPAATLTPDALLRLQNYEWPGNVRELRNVLVRAFVMTGPYITGPDIRFSSENVMEPTTTQEAASEAEERRMVFEVMTRVAGNRTRASQILGIPRSSLLYRLRKWGMT